MKRTGPTNVHLRNLIVSLEKTKKPIWKRVAELLSRPTRKRIVVNVHKLNKLKGNTFVVPGVLLGDGKVERAITVAAWKVTPKARKRIEEAGGRILSIEEMLESFPEGKGVVIVA